MKRPVGITITVVLMAIVCVRFVRGAIDSGSVMHAVPLLALTAVVGRAVFGLWTGELWAYHAFRVLLVVACLASVALLALGSERHGPLWYAGRSAVMAAWAYYFFRPKVRAWFDDDAVIASSQPT